MPGFFRGSALERKTADTGRGLPKCGICKFAPNCNSPRMEPAGTGASGVLIVGEAPGEEEDASGKHFMGEGGDRLRDSLKEIGVSYKDAWKTYAMICSPKHRTWTDVNINACRPSLLRTIDELKPKVIILLGAAPVRSLMPVERGGSSTGAHGRWVGFNIPSFQHKAWLCPTYSPAQIFRYNEDPAILTLFHRHLRQAFSLVNKKPPAVDVRDLNAKIEIITSTSLARKRMNDLSKKEGILAFDYEANSIKPDRPEAKLYAVSFCLNGEDTFACLLNESLYPELAAVLQSKRLAKVASNMKNEDRWTKRKLGFFVPNWYWDTMLAAHCLDNRKEITSIKFQAFLYFGIPNYDRFTEPYFRNDKRTGLNTIHKMDHKDLLTYNGLDSLLEFMVCMEQRKAFGLNGY